MVHRARLRKNYFKLLDKEGISHEKQPEEGAQNGSDDENESGEEEGASEEEIDEKDSSSRSRKPLPLQDSLPKRAPPNPTRVPPKPTRKPLNFAERARIAKERKEQLRQEKLAQVQARRKTIERKTQERDRKKDRLLKTTKTGQPLMGPRINNLLDKIRQNNQ